MWTEKIGFEDLIPTGDKTRKFWDEDAAYDFIEHRVWPDGPVCPHCGGVDQIGRLQGLSTRTRTYKCYRCRKPFTVKIGTIFEHSKVPMYKWLQAMVLCRDRRRHFNANQVCKVLDVTFKTAKTMLTLIRKQAHGLNDKNSGQLFLQGPDRRRPGASDRHGITFNNSSLKRQTGPGCESRELGLG